MTKNSINPNQRKAVPSGFTPFLKSSRNQLRVLAVGCVATGAVGVILLPGAAQAPAIVPAGSVVKPQKTSLIAPLPSIDFDQDFQSAAEGKAPRTPATRSVAQTQSEIQKISVEFRNAKVTDLLAMVAMQGDIGITIGSDIEDELEIPYIRLNNVTPEQAIGKIALGASLHWKKLEDKTFFVGKALSSDSQGSSARGIRPLSAPDEESVWVDETALPVMNARAKQPGTPFPTLFDTTKTNQREPRIQRPIRARNVRPGILAWWVDPEHHEMPYEFARAQANMSNDLDRNMLQPALDPEIYAKMYNPTPAAAALPFATPYVPGAYANPYANPVFTRTNEQNLPNNQNGQNNGQSNINGQNGRNGGGGGGGGTLRLPDGIDQVVAIDSQNVLLVYGTADAVAQLQTIIDYLDRPIRQVEIEAQFIDVSVNELRGFGIQFFNGPIPTPINTGTGTGGTGTSNNNTVVNSIGQGIPGANQLTISYGQYKAQLSLLAQSGNSRIISSPRVTTMNNLSASLQSSQTTPIILTSSTSGIGGQVAQAQQAFSLTTSVGIQVTPTILNDDTITVFVTPQVQTQSPTPGLGGGNTPSIPTVLSQSLTTVANVKDSDVIVLGGLRTRSEATANTRIPILSSLPIIGKLFQSRNKTDVDRELVIFLTARIYRRTDDIAPFQGP